MATHVALLRAVNVGGTGKLPMVELRTLCEQLGLKRVRTYIQSGNVVAESALAPRNVKSKLETALAAKLGKPCRVLVRTREELEAVEGAIPFPRAEPAKLLIVFLDKAPPADALHGWKIPGGEELRLIGRELFIHFPDGMGRSKLKVPFAEIGTGRNLNTLRALISLARAAP